jgi:enoyl-[acyl-carrier protein] reductase II
VRTRLTDLLDIRHPVMLAGMGGVSYHHLVAAVSEAGGIGTLGASTMREGELADEMAGVRRLTSAPFGVDLLTALPSVLERDVETVISGGARIFVAGLGVPRDVIDHLHRHQVLVGSMCGKVRHAIAAVESGCDFVVAQGTEGGGHTGTVATMALVPQVVDAVGDRVVVVAAGGIYDGRGLAAALAMGADGVWVGTRFIATPEARAVNGYKDALVAAHEDGTVITRAYTGKTCRVLRNVYSRSPRKSSPPCRPASTTSASPRAPRSMSRASFTLQARELAAWTRSFPPASSSSGSCARPRPRSATLSPRCAS